MNEADNTGSEDVGQLAAQGGAQTRLAPRTGAADLKPKGACWYCNAPLDNIRRFCNKACATDYQTEEETFR